MVTVGYGDITPKNPDEVKYNCIAMLIGCGMFAYGLNVVGGLVDKLSRKNDDFKYKSFFYINIK